MKKDRGKIRANKKAAKAKTTNKSTTKVVNETPVEEVATSTEAKDNSNEVLLDNLARMFQMDRDKIEDYIKSTQENFLKSSYYGVLFLPGEKDDDYKVNIPATSDLKILDEDYSPELLAKYVKEMIIKDRAEYGLDDNIVFMYSTRDENWTKEKSDNIVDGFKKVIALNPLYPFSNSNR